MDTQAVAADRPGGRHGARGRYLAALCLATLGIVYGDIGTSPLYALRECFAGSHPVAASPDNVLGVLSLIFWALVVVVTLKYHVYVLRMDNRGEGGILALMALLRPGRGTGAGWHGELVLIGLFGAALLYGDGIITPAISVLSAVEGLEIATPVFRPVVVPITVGILVGLFLVQHRGTARIGGVRPRDAGGSPRSPARPGQHRPPAVGARRVSRSTPCASSPTTASSAFSCSAPCSCARPAARRSTRTWATSASGRSRSTGSCWSDRR
jgi:hypothetical protein